MISKITLTGAGGADPVTVLQDNWSSLPSGSYPIYISVGAAYGAIVMNASGDYGAAIIFNYSGIFAIVEKYQQEWSVSDITTHNDLRAENGAISWASSDFTHPGTNALYKNRYAATLTLTLQSSSTVTTWQDVAILPVKPMQTIYVGNATDYEKVNIQITSGGVVQARNMSGNSNYYTGSITFLI